MYLRPLDSIICKIYIKKVVTLQLYELQPLLINDGRIILNVLQRTLTLHYKVQFCFLREQTHVPHYI